MPGNVTRTGAVEDVNSMWLPFEAQGRSVGVFIHDLGAGMVRHCARDSSRQQRHHPDGNVVCRHDLPQEQMTSPASRQTDFIDALERRSGQGVRIANGVTPPGNTGLIRQTVYRINADPAGREKALAAREKRKESH